MLPPPVQQACDEAQVAAVLSIAMGMVKTAHQMVEVPPPPIPPEGMLQLLTNPEKWAQGLVASTVAFQGNKLVAEALDRMIQIGMYGSDDELAALELARETFREMNCPHPGENFEAKATAIRNALDDVARTLARVQGVPYPERPDPSGTKH